MVIELTDSDKEYFVSFVKEIILGSPTKAAKMVYQISKYENKLIHNRGQSDYIYQNYY